MVIDKTQVVDLKKNELNQYKKIEGFAVGRSGSIYFLNDNDFAKKSIQDREEGSFVFMTEILK